MAKLSFRYGAMNSGKSTILMQIAYNFEENSKKVLLLKSNIDTKGEDKLVSRIGLERKVDILLTKDATLFNCDYLQKIKNVDALLVDEAQFLKESQVEELWVIAKELDIPVLCYGLKTDFTSHTFKGSKRLLELADELIELTTICNECGKKARFNARKVAGEYVENGSQVVIDGSTDTLYVSLCGKCYLEKVLKKKL